MQINNPAPGSGENAWLWLLKIGSGVLVFAILGVHFVVNHFVMPGGLLTFYDVVAYYRNPWIPIMEGFFLVFVISHSLLGVRSILLDLDLSPGVMRGLNIVLTILGAAASVYGIWLLIAVATFN